nr:immunoglobulin light chain junction region [Macaca mulatta]
DYYCMIWHNNGVFF